MKYIDVRVRIPIKHMGQFIEDLPDYAHMTGYDKLADADVPTRQIRKANGEYPKKGTVGEVILKLLAKQPLSSSEVIGALIKKHKKGSINSSFYTLARKKVIVKQKDGRYVIAH
jgi:predicted PilT family ATPase